MERERETTSRERLMELRASLRRDAEKIDEAYALLIETMAAASERLLEATREADTSLPAMSGGIGEAVEIKLAETREVTLRFESSRGATRGPAGS